MNTSESNNFSVKFEKEKASLQSSLNLVDVSLLLVKLKKYHFFF